MTKQETYEAMYAQLERWQAEGEQVCSDWYARFCEVARQAYDARIIEGRDFGPAQPLTTLDS